MCGLCKKLSDFGLEKLEDDCMQCCQREAEDTETKVTFALFLYWLGLVYLVEASIECSVIRYTCINFVCEIEISYFHLEVVWHVSKNAEHLTDSRCGEVIAEANDKQHQKWTNCEHWKYGSLVTGCHLFINNFGHGFSWMMKLRTFWWIDGVFLPELFFCYSGDMQMRIGKTPPYQR